MKQQLLLIFFLTMATSGLAEMRVVYGDATIVERSELIVVGHLDVKSIKHIPHEKKPNEGRSWEHHARLIIKEVLKGECETNEIPITIHYGLDPIVGGYVKRDGFMMDIRHHRKDYPTNRVEIMDTGNSVISFMPLVEDAAADNLWFLQRRNGVYGRELGKGDFGIADPGELQPLELKDYFLCYLAYNSRQAVEKYGASHPEIRQRSKPYFDHLEVQRILKISDPGARFDALLPYYLKGQSWDNKREARAGIVSCGIIAGERLVAVFNDPARENHRQDIILLWRDVNYTEVAPLLIKLLVEHDKFWARQELTNGWWNAGAGSELTQRRRNIYGEVYYAVSALRSFNDPRSREAIELTKKRWETIQSDNPQILDECNAALKSLPN